MSSKISNLTEALSVLSGDILTMVRGTTNYKITTDNLGLIGGWTSVADPWTYASATTITIPSDGTTVYSVGMKLRLKQGGAYKYFIVVGVAATLLTVTGGSDYSVANSSITNIAYSVASTPFGFPTAFNYTPTGISASNSTLSGRFSTSGRRCFCSVQCLFSGGITFTTMPTIPITGSSGIKSSIYYSGMGVGGYYHSSAGNSFTLSPAVQGSGTVVNISRASDNTPLSATVPVTWANGDGFLIEFSYEF